MVPKVAKPKRKSAAKPAKPATPATQSSSWQPLTFESLPSFGSQRQKIDWHLQYFNHDAYGDWKLVGLALSGESDGYEIWSDWSRQSHKFDEVTQQAEWEKIQEERKKRIKEGKTVAGFGLLVKRARERGCPLVRDVGEYQPVHKPSNRVNLVVLRGGVGEALANLFCPDGQSWALLNPDGADNVLSPPKTKPLQSAILDHIGGSTRRLRHGGKTLKVKTCVVVMPQPMTRSWAIGVRDAGEANLTQLLLASMGLSSISYPLCSQLQNFALQAEPETKKGSHNGQIVISYIYKADALSTNDDLGKMTNQGSCYPFSDAMITRSVIEHIVLVAFSKPIPQQLLQHTILIVLKLVSRCKSFLLDLIRVARATVKHTFKHERLYYYPPPLARHAIRMRAFSYRLLHG